LTEELKNELGKWRISINAQEPTLKR